MRRIHIHHTEIDTAEGFNKFTSEVSGVIYDNSITFTSEMLNGKVSRIDIEEGLNLKAWQLLHEREGLDFDKEPFIDNRGEKVFSLIFLLTPNLILLKNSFSKKEIGIKGLKNIPLISNNTYYTIQAAPHQPVKTVEIGMTATWLKKILSETSESVTEFIDNITSSNEPTLYLGTCSSDCRSTLQSLHQYSLEGKKSILYFHSNLLRIISDFFDSSVEAGHQNPDDLGKPQKEQIVFAERLLNDYLDKNLPSLSSIAKEVSMSESTLRRHFKQVYGKNIYEYYLEKKMDYANRMLLNFQYNVNEIATKLGYEKVSSFINAFKKIYGYSPGSIRKNGSNNRDSDFNQ